MLGGEVRRDPARVVAGDGEADDADPLGGVRPDPQHLDAGEAAQAGDEAVRAVRLVGLQGAVGQRGEGAAGGGASAAAPSTFGVPPSCRCGAAAHAAAVGT